MAGGGSLGGAEKPKRGKSKRKKKKRVGFHLDMTPLVDITFLLLTFFMFTTTMAQPQVMEMSYPPEGGTTIDVADDKLIEIRVDKDGEIFYNLGTDQPEQIEMKELKDRVVEENLKKGKINEMITVLIPHKNAEYGEIVQILDELNLAEMEIIDEMSDMTDPETGKPYERKRRFTIAPMSEEDEEKIAIAKGEPIESEEE